jgi:hypothetical protein
MDLQDVRDVVLIIYGITAILMFLAILIVTVVVGYLIIRLLRVANSTVQTNVVPILDTSRDTLVNVRGTARFVTENAVQPIIRVASAYAGLRRGVAVFTGFQRLRRRG